MAGIAAAVFVAHKGQAPEGFWTTVPQTSHTDSGRVDSRCTTAV